MVLYRLRDGKGRVPLSGVRMRGGEVMEDRVRTLTKERDEARRENTALRAKLAEIVKAGKALVGCMEARELRFCTDESAECFDVMMSALDEIGGEE